MNGHKPHYLLQYFATGHLRGDLAEVSRPFGELAQALDRQLPGSPEKSVCMRKLLEAKDCAVRAALWQGSSEEPRNGDSRC
jgi:hypothetical protein